VVIDFNLLPVTVVFFCSGKQWPEAGYPLFVKEFQIFDYHLLLTAY
jgi:hypothetical protein